MNTALHGAGVIWERFRVRCPLDVQVRVLFPVCCFSPSGLGDLHSLILRFSNGISDLHSPRPADPFRCLDEKVVSVPPPQLPPQPDQGKDDHRQAQEQGQNPQVPLDLLLEGGDDPMLVSSMVCIRAPNPRTRSVTRDSNREARKTGGGFRPPGTRIQRVLLNAPGLPPPQTL